MKKIFKVLLVCVFIICFTNVVFANYDINATLNKEYKIIYNDEVKNLYNANGIQVYPIFYEDTNYLPIRAVSSLFDIEIKWDGQNGIIYLGSGEADKVASKTCVTPINENKKAIVNHEIKVIYSGEIQKFFKHVGDTNIDVYPISYQGTTYLPIRNITELFGGLIEWDGVNKVIKINSKDYITINSGESNQNITEEYSIEKIKEEFFDKNLDYNFINLLCKDDKCTYYYDSNGDLFDIYCFNNITNENKKIVSISKEVTLGEGEFTYTEKMIQIEFLGKYNDILYIYPNTIAGNIGNTIGRVCCIDGENV